MKYLLDTDTLIYWLHGDERIETSALQAGLDNLGFSIVSLAELFYGAFGSSRVDRNLKSIHRMKEALRLVDFDEDAANHFGKTKAQLRNSGNLIPDADLMIASTAIANDRPLVTNNTRHFQKISELTLVNWSTT